MPDFTQIVDVFKCCIFDVRALTVVLPAFFLAGAISVFVPVETVKKYLGSQSRWYVSYPFAAVTGMVLPVCSCNVVPIFASILARGAGIGPAFTFLFAGPALSLVSVFFTFSALGWGFGVARLSGVFLLSVVIGLSMAWVFPAGRQDCQLQENTSLGAVISGRRVIYLCLLIFCVIISGAFAAGKGPAGTIIFIASVISLAAFSFSYYSREELRNWMKAVWDLLRTIIPLFLMALVLIALAAKFIDIRLIKSLFSAPRGVLGTRGFIDILQTTFYAAGFGELMYFPMLSEVALAKTLLKLGADVGPALALLLAGPGTSLPGFIILRKFVSVPKLAVYFLLCLTLETVFAAAVSVFWGDYICACLFVK